jgi:hypothetical protein
MRRKHKTIDEIYMGKEPEWNAENPCPTGEKERSSAYSGAVRWYNYYSDKKKYTKTCLNYCQKELKFSKEDMQAMKKLPDWKVYMKNHNFVKLQERGWKFHPEQMESGNNNFYVLLKEGHKLLKLHGIEKESKPKAPVISPHERTRRKVINTIYGDWDEMVVDKWMDGIFDKKIVKFPTYSLFQLHGLKGAAINIFREHVMIEYQAVKDAYDKTDEQAVEAYSHVKKGDKKKMLTLMESIFEDLDRVKDTARVARTANQKPKTRDVQVKKLNYLKDHEDSKVVSINPVLIPQAGWLWTYNTKTKRLTEFKTSSTKGFEVRGSTLHNWDEQDSRVTVLRKPLDILPQILNKTIKQIDNVWKGLTTKVTKPTGRINKDTILLRAEEYVR